jgi:hypothetical protein
MRNSIERILRHPIYAGAYSSVERYLWDALSGLFALGEKPTTEPLLDWLPDRGVLNQTRNMSIDAATAG